jgi:hypothetical protein
MCLTNAEERIHSAFVCGALSYGEAERLLGFLRFGIARHEGVSRTTWFRRRQELRRVGVDLGTLE